MASLTNAAREHVAMLRDLELRGIDELLTGEEDDGSND